MKKFLFLFLLCPLFSYAQHTNKDTVYSLVEQMPKFKGDVPTYLHEVFQYPEQAAFKSIQGIVHVGFVVEKDGSLSNIHIEKSVERSLDSASIVWVTGMPKWNPGMEKGQPVRVKYQIPIRFTLPTIDPGSVNPSTPPPVK